MRVPEEAAGEDGAACSRDDAHFSLLACFVEDFGGRLLLIIKRRLERRTRGVDKGSTKRRQRITRQRKNNPDLVRKNENLMTNELTLEARRALEATFEPNGLITNADA